MSRPPSKQDHTITIPETRRASRARLRAVERRRPRLALPARRRARLGLILFDAVALQSALAIVAFARVEIPWLGWRLALSLAVGFVAQLVVLGAVGLYRLWRMDGWDEVRRLVAAVGLWVILVAIATPWWTGAVSRSFLLTTWLIGLVLVFAMRTLFRWTLGRARAQGELAMRAAVVGTAWESTTMAHRLAEDATELVPVGYVALRDEDRAQDGIPVMGSIDDLIPIIEREGIECVVMPPTGLSDGEVLQVARICRAADIEVKMWVNVPDILGPRMSIQPIDGRMALALESSRPTLAQAAVKRAFDLIVSSLLLLVGLPFLLLVAAAIKLTSRGPVLFRQPRVTRDGRVFTMYKFRTMVNEPEKAFEGTTLDLTQPFFKMKDDPRLTRVGRLLRHLSLDELPQLLNVLKGDMSMVGPRPLPAEQVEANGEFLAPRHEVRGGITGWWQISGRSALDSERALRLDRWYIENWSIGLDLYILLRTITAVIARRGAW